VTEITPESGRRFVSWIAAEETVPSSRRRYFVLAFVIEPSPARFLAIFPFLSPVFSTSLNSRCRYQPLVLRVL
jgi:hypothetical protein